MMLIEEFLELEKDTRAFDRCGRAPIIMRGASCRHGLSDVRAACHRHTRGHFVCGRIKDIHLARAAPSEKTAVNEVFDSGRGDLAIARNHRFALSSFEFWLHKTLWVFRLSAREEDYTGLHCKPPLVYRVVVGMPAAL